MALERRSVAADKLYFLSRYFMCEDIRTGSPVRLIPNEIQLDLELSQSSVNVILKSRKPGISTWIDASIFWESLFRPHLRAAIIAHDREATNQLFDRLIFAYDNLPDWLKQPRRRSSRKEISFLNLNSHIRALTAGNVRIGRGSDLDRIHFSEAAFYPNLQKMISGVSQALRPGSMIWWESTANGFNEFRDLYVEARDGQRRATAFFYPWFRDPKNRIELDGQEKKKLVETMTKEERELQKIRGLVLEQIAFRREKQVELKEEFPQEFPDDDETCFLSTGVPKFDVAYWRTMLTLVEQRVRPIPFEILIRTRPRVVDLNDGKLVIWKLPKPGERFVAGADVAEGLPPYGDFSHLGVLNVTELARREQVAEWHGYLNPADFGITSARIALFFNRALLAFERNNHGHAAIVAAKRIAGYYPLYRHREIDAKGRSVGRYGFPTTPGNRESLLSKCQVSIKAGEHIVRSTRFCRECITFQSGDEDLDPDSPRRRTVKDDSVIGWSIADWIALRGAAIPVG